jgi:hypothetical protein
VELPGARNLLTISISIRDLLCLSVASLASLASRDSGGRCLVVLPSPDSSRFGLPDPGRRVILASRDSCGL